MPHWDFHLKIIIRLVERVQKGNTLFHCVIQLLNAHSHLTGGSTPTWGLYPSVWTSEGQDHILMTVTSTVVPHTWEPLNKQWMTEGMARNILCPSWRFLSEAEHHDKGNGTRMLNHTKGSVYQKSSVVHCGRVVSKGIKTFSISRSD